MSFNIETCRKRCKHSKILTTYRQSFGITSGYLKYCEFCLFEESMGSARVGMNVYPLFTIST